jgi:hypothetical protein
VIYAFDEADPDLTLMPMATRRALDAVGIKLSLSSYQTLALTDRRELVRLGAAPEVDTLAVKTLVVRADGPAPKAQPPVVEPADLPVALVEALAPERTLEPAQWKKLSALDRYVLDQLQRRGRQERLQAAFDEIVGARG